MNPEQQDTEFANVSRERTLYEKLGRAQYALSREVERHGYLTKIVELKREVRRLTFLIRAMEEEE